MMPIPPSRARAIARRASVTVSIAAETIGISSAIVARQARARSRHRSAALPTRPERAARRRRSRPSLPNLPSRSSSNSKSRSTLPSVPSAVSGPAPGGRARRRRGCSSSTARRATRGGPPPSGRSGRRRPRAPTPRPPRRRAAGPPPPGVCVGQRGEPAREQHVAGAEHRDGFELRRLGAVAPHLALLADEREAARLERDVDVAGAHLGDRSSAIRKSSSSSSSWPTSCSASCWFGETSHGSASMPRRSGSPSASSTTRAPSLVSSRTAPRRSPRRRPAAASRRRPPSTRRARGSGASRAGSRARPAVTFGPHSLISVYVPGGRVDDGGGGARLVLDPDEVVEDRLRGQLLDDPRARAAAREARWRRRARRAA